MTKSEKNQEYTHAVGRRKTAVARVRIINDKSKGLNITVNGKDFKEYFPYFQWQDTILSPLKVAGRENITISVRVAGGGQRGQADSVGHGIARALLKTDETLRPNLKKEKLLTRDSRKKERKKPGLKKARKAPQWSKR